MGVHQGQGDRSQAQLDLRPHALGRMDAPAVEGASTPRARAHAKARRHSLLVRILKWAIPLGAITAAGTIAAVAALESFAPLEGLAIGPLTLSGTRVTMESPRLMGYRSQSGPYEVTASAAMQDVRKPGLIELQDLKARLAIDQKGATAQLEAASGLLDTKKELFELSRGVRVQSDHGREVRLQSASVDFRAGTVVSNEPVTVTFESGVIEAGGVEVSDNGRVLHFKGRVRTTFSGPLAAEISAAVPAPTSEAAKPIETPARASEVQIPNLPARTSQADAGGVR
jgi:lipopolysaccharide export system protein LptC